MTIPTYESLESLKLISVPTDPHGTGGADQQVLVCTGGEQGALKLWDSETGDLLYTKDRLDSSSYEITSTVLSHNSTLFVLTSDQTFQEFSIKASPSNLELTLQSSIVAHTDQVLNVKFLSSPPEVLLTTNASFLKCINPSNGDTSLTYGHKDMIISLAVSPDSRLVATGSKDSTIIIWSRTPSPSPSFASTFTLLHRFTGHTGPVTCLAFTLTSDFVLSGSADKTVKKWSLGNGSSRDAQSAVYTFLAHENDITAIKASPCRTQFITCSLDKTAKVFIPPQPHSNSNTHTHTLVVVGLGYRRPSFPL